MQKARQGKPNQIVSNVRIVTLSDVPPAFLLRPKVIAAIRKEVLQDLKRGLKRIPAGVEADWKNPNLLQRAKMKMEELWKKVTKS